MRIGTPFEVTKDVYDRAQQNRGYMISKDQDKFFSDAILYGYGLYNCRVQEKDGKYICTYETGSTCD